MDAFAVGVEDDEDGVAESARIVQSFHRFKILVGFAGVDMNPHVVVFDDGSDDAIFFCEICKTQTPGTPVPSYLAEDELVFGLSLFYSFVDLVHGIDALVVDFGQSLFVGSFVLCHQWHREKERDQQGEGFLHVGYLFL